MTSSKANINKVLNETCKSLDEVTANVKFLLELCEDYRNNDNLLICAYWDRFDQDKPIKYMTSAATIFRVRQKIQSQGEYEPTDPDVIRHRESHRRNVTKWVRNLTV